MIRSAFTIAAMLAVASPVMAQDKLVVSIWGGSWRDAVAEIAGKRFTEETGVEVEYITGGTGDRLTKASIAGATPESDVTFTTSHVSRLYAASGLLETLDLEKIPNAADLFPVAKQYPEVLGTWSYAYTIAYRPDLVPEGVDFSSWEALWDPAMEGKLALHGRDPSHIIGAAAALEGVDLADWTKLEDKLLALKPNIKAFYATDANSQEMLASGEAPVQVLLTSNGYIIGETMPVEIVIPKEGAIAGIDVVGINKNAAHLDLAYKFLDIMFDPEVQRELAVQKKFGPMNTKTELPPEVADLPGVFDTVEEWQDQTILIDDNLRAELLGAWREWFAENMQN